jgi:hypothetical protein
MRRLSTVFKESSFFSEDVTSLDDSLRNLYQDPSILDKKCSFNWNENEEENKEENNNDSSTNRRKSNNFSSTKTPESVVEGLSHEYYKPDFDPVHDTLLDVSSWDKNLSHMELTSKFMMKIEDTDSDKDMILYKLSDMIEDNYGDLMHCMRDVHAIDIDLTRASLQIGGGRRKIGAASTKITAGPLKIVSLNKTRERLILISDTLKCLKNIKDMYKSMQKRITTGDVGRAAEYACTALDSLRKEPFSKFEALKDTIVNIQKSLYTTRYKTDKALMRLCSRKFSSTEYSNIIRSYLVLDYLADSMNMEIIDQNEGKNDENHDILFDVLGCMEGISPRIQRFQLEDIDACLHNAVLEFIYASQQKKRKAAAEVDIAGAYSQMNMDEMMDLTEIERDILYARITPDMAAPCIIRSCELLADIVHTHYLITQWHGHPFDPRNDDIHFLHRCPIDSGSSDYDSNETEIVFNKSLLISKNKSVNNTIQSDKLGSINENNIQNAFINESTSTTNSKEIDEQREFRLSTAYHDLVSHRVKLWDQIQTAIIGILNCIKFSAAVNLDNFYAVSWTINAMIRLGNEFCSADCKSLSICWFDKSKDYFNKLQNESLQTMRQITEAEQWGSVPVKLKEVGGILGIIKMKLAARSADSNNLRNCIVGMQVKKVNSLVISMMDEDMSRKLSTANMLDGESKSVDYDESILMLFGTHGNPLHFMTDGERHTDKDISEEVVENNQIALIEEDFLSILMEESTTKKRGNDMTGSMVVTQSCLNGISRYTGKYLQMMHLISTSSSDIFHGLCQLFDYYFCTVYNGFVSEEQKQKFLTKQTKTTVLAPDQIFDFEALESYLEQTLNEPVFIELDPALRLSDSDITKMTNILQIPTEVETSNSETFFALHEKIVAAESCWFAAKVLFEIKLKIMRLLPDRYLSICEEYVNKIQLVAGQLRGLIYKVMCPQLIKETIIIQQILESSNGWDSRKVKISQNDWVNQLVLTCAEVFL